MKVASSADACQQALIKAYREALDLHGEHHELEAMTATLKFIGPVSSSTASARKYREISANASERELRGLLGPLVELDRKMESLSQTSILRLADDGLLVAQSLPTKAQIIAVLEKASKGVSVGRNCKSFAGAPKKVLPDAVATVLMKHYEQLLGVPATVIFNTVVYTGRFIELVERVFKVLGIKDSASAAAVRVVSKKNRG